MLSIQKNTTFKPLPFQMSLLKSANLNSGSGQMSVKTPVDQFTPQQGGLAHLSPNDAISAAESLLSGEAKPSVDITTVQEQLTRELPDLDVQFLHTDRFGKLNGRLATEKELCSMMESLFEESEIPFGYITDGCYARAHLMDESFRQHGINHGKMFVRGDLAAENDIMTARWWYHVAPLVFVDNGQGEPVPKIIDPGFSLKPMDPEQWVKTMNQGPRIQVDLVKAAQYHPRRYRSPGSFAESLPPAVRRMQDYSYRLHGIKEDKGLPVDPYTKPSWAEPGSGGDFLVDGERHTVFPEGVRTKGRFYLPTGLGVAPLQLDLFADNGEDVSAAWDNRPEGFDPYA